VSVPDEFDAVEAAPLLCAGVTVFKALKKSGIQPGQTVAIQGIGGLGHLAVQFARKMGLRTIAIARGADKERLAIELGAHHYINSNKTGEESSAATALKALGGANVILSTVSKPSSVSSMIAGLAPHGRLIVVGLGAELIEVSPFALVPNDVSIHGSLTGSSFESEETLAFSAMQDIRTRIETFPLADAHLAYARMMRNEAQFRIVLVP
jgi:D-arabinose 1-dehydrogenase-like Zn-dependent alcohol dehydrogenase